MTCKKLLHQIKLQQQKKNLLKRLKSDYLCIKEQRPGKTLQLRANQKFQKINLIAKETIQPNTRKLSQCSLTSKKREYLKRNKPLKIKASLKSHISKFTNNQRESLIALLLRITQKHHYSISFLLKVSKVWERSYIQSQLVTKVDRN